MLAARVAAASWLAGWLPLAGWLGELAGARRRQEDLKCWLASRRAGQPATRPPGARRIENAGWLAGDPATRPSGHPATRRQEDLKCWLPGWRRPAGWLGHPAGRRQEDSKCWLPLAGWLPWGVGRRQPGSQHFKHFKSAGI